MLPASLNLRLLVQCFVLAGLVSSCVIVTRNLLQGGAIFPPSEVPSTVGGPFQGVVLSIVDSRYNHTKTVLEKLNMVVSQQLPHDYRSAEVSDGLEKYQGSRALHSDTFLKVYSNRLAFTEALQSFVDDKKSGNTSWRFFFEDDIQLHPSLTPERAQTLLSRGLDVAASDGIVYLGICGPQCSGHTMGLFDVNSARCAGTCAHAFGFTKWKAALFLSSMENLVHLGSLSPATRLYFDQLLLTFGQKVHPIWTLGSNLRSPISPNIDHYGLLFQDRNLFHSTIG